MGQILKDMKKDRPAQIEHRRSFLVEGIPEPLAAADSHLQIFDNYIENTLIHLRSIRVPETNNWSRFLEKRIPNIERGWTRWEVFQIPLSASEYSIFTPFKGREIRKNRYFYANGDREIEIDIYLGPLWGLNIAKLYFDGAEDIASFPTPKISLVEITENEFFFGNNIVDKSFEDIRVECQKLINTQKSDGPV